MRMRPLKFAAAALAAICLAASLASCSPPESTHAPDTLQVDIENSPASTDPRYSTDAMSSRINELIFDSLVRVDRNGEFLGDAAESFERRSPTELVFHLRRGLYFSNGRELTSRDVKFTYDSITDAANNSPKRAALTMARLKSVEAPDRYTVAITTREPYAPALEIGMQGIVPENSRKDAAVGSGPFMVETFNRDESMVLERNPHRVYPERAARKVVFKIVPDATVRALELAEGVCDFAENNIEPDLIPYLAAQPNLLISKSPGNGYRYLSFNFHDPGLRDVRVRRAIAFAIDRESLVNSFKRGTARISTGLLSPESWAYGSGVTAYRYDPAHAAALLEEAGYPLGANRMRDLKFAFRCTPEQVRFAEAIQAMLRRVGIALSVSTNEFATFYSDIQGGNFDLTSMNWVGVNDPNHYYMIFDSRMVPPAGYNRGAYSNRNMDALLEAGAVSLDRSERKAIYAKVQQLAADDLPYVSLWWDDTVAAMNRRVIGFEPYPNGSMRSLATVTLDPGTEPNR